MAAARAPVRIGESVSPHCRESASSAVGASLFTSRPERVTFAFLFGVGFGLGAGDGAVS